MTEPKQIDPERLAALLDGRLSDAEAAIVRAELASADDDTLSAYADAVAVSAEVGSAAGPVAGATPAVPTPAKVIPIASAQRWRRWIVPAVTAAAAAMVAVVVLPGRNGSPYRPATYASAVSTDATIPDLAWSGTRGGSNGPGKPALAVRVGALLTDLELGAIRDDTNSVHARARDLRTLLNRISGGDIVASMLDSLPTASSAGDRRKQLKTIGRRAIALVDPPFANAGAYLEAARAATASGGTAFFGDVRGNPLDTLSRDSRLDSSMQTRIRELSALIAATPPSGPAIHTAVEELLRDLAR